MNKKLSIIMSLFVLTLTAYARLGWTEAQMEKKYGKGEITFRDDTDLKGSISKVFKTKRWGIKVAFLKNEVVYICYYKLAGGFLTNEENRTISDLNLQGAREWIYNDLEYPRLGETKWTSRRSDGKARKVRLKTRTNFDGKRRKRTFLSFMTEDWYNAKEKRSTEEL